MNINKFISRTLLVGIFLNNLSIISNAEILSSDERYETFVEDNIKIDDVLEEELVDIKIGGNTLVNYADYSNTEYTKNNTIIDYDTKEILFNTVDISTNTEYTDSALYFKTNLRVGETYTLIINVLENNMTETNMFKILDSWNSYVSNEEGRLNYGQTGLIKAKFTVKENNNGLFKIYLRHYNNQEEKGFVKIKDIMILKGDWTNKETPGYFEGMKSVGELENNTLELISRNKNLWDGTYELGSIYTGEDGCYPGEDSTLGINRKRSNYIPVKPNTTYTISQKDFLDAEQSGIFIHQYNEYKQNILWSEGLSYKMIRENLTFTTDSNTYYLRFRTQNNRELTPDTVMLEEGNVATNIIEQYNNKKVIQLNEPLRGLPNGVRDRIIKRDNQWVIERNIKSINLKDAINKLGGHWAYEALEDKFGLFNMRNGTLSVPYNDSQYAICNSYATLSRYGTHNGEFAVTPGYMRFHNDFGFTNVQEWLNYINNNDIIVIYQLATPIYEPIKTDLSVNLFEGTTHVSNNSTIPATMEVTVDRALNRAVEYSELAKTNPTINNLSKARYWNNLLKESTKKDQLQEEVNSITTLNDMELERKIVTSNLDLYIKSENILQMSLSTNSITFEDFSGVEDMVKENAVQISINSSLPYSLNAYLPTEIQNSDKSNTMNKDILNIKENSESTYQTFTNTTNKIVLKDNCSGGNDLIHNIDIKLKGGIAHEKDVYKTTIKFEAEQK